MNSGFDKRQSSIVKGTAILMMMWHHCFLPSRFESFPISFFPLGVSLVLDISYLFKICVSLFVFVSGYGLYISFHEWHTANKNSSCWIWQRYVRTFSGYWLIVVLSWIICTLINNRPAIVYVRPSRVAGVVYALIDLLGLHNLFQTPSVNGTWWYMSAAFVYIFLIPLLYCLLQQLGNLCCFVLLFLIPRIFIGYPGEIAALSFVPILCLGMICARIHFFEKLDKFIADNRCRWLIVSTVTLIICVILFLISRRLPNERFWDIKWDLIPFAYILFVYLVLSRIPGLNKALDLLGKHSANIFMIHTFYRHIYTRNFVYSRGHFLLIIITLLLMSLFTSFVLEGLKKLIRYERFTQWMENLFSPSCEIDN